MALLVLGFLCVVHCFLCDSWRAQFYSRQRDFYEIARRAGTDKVTTHQYQHVYQRFLGPLSHDETDEFLMIEIGFAGGASARAFREFLPRGELHEVEVGCVRPRTPHYNDWIYDAPLFSVMRKEGRLHCGSGASRDFMLALLDKLRRTPAVVIDDGGHSAEEMIGSFNVLFPRLAACGLFFMEDLQESYRVGAHGFHNKVMRPALDAVHYAADDNAVNRLRGNMSSNIVTRLRSVHCAQHICVFERNDEPPLSSGTSE
jgi:hypothetical protein